MPKIRTLITFLSISLLILGASAATIQTVRAEANKSIDPIEQEVVPDSCTVKIRTTLSFYYDNPNEIKEGVTKAIKSNGISFLKLGLPLIAWLTLKFAREWLFADNIEEIASNFTDPNTGEYTEMTIKKFKDKKILRWTKKIARWLIEASSLEDWSKRMAIREMSHLLNQCYPSFLLYLFR